MAYGQGQANVAMPRSSREAHPDYGSPSPGGLQDTMCSKQSAVAIALDMLNENAQGVAQMLDMLEQRLLTVLRNEPQLPPMKDEPCDGVVVPLSQAITASVVSLAKTKERLGSILQRLEL